MTGLVVAAATAASFLPGISDALQYQRARVEAGHVWLLLTAHLVHWSPRMALADLGALLILGCLLETRRRPAAALCLGTGAIVTGAGIHLLLPGIDLYRGASGVASALFIALGLDLLVAPAPRAARGWAGAAGVLFAAKIGWEVITGEPLAAGELPPGVRVSPEVHVIGAAAGAAAWVAFRLISSGEGLRRGGPGS